MTRGSGCGRTPPRRRLPTNIAPGQNGGRPAEAACERHRRTALVGGASCCTPPPSLINWTMYGFFCNHSALDGGGRRGGEIHIRSNGPSNLPLSRGCAAIYSRDGGGGGVRGSGGRGPGAERINRLGSRARPLQIKSTLLMSDDEWLNVFGPRTNKPYLETSI